MELSKAIAAAKNMVGVNAGILNAVVFGPDSHDRHSGALISLALQHLNVITDLLDPSAMKWPSAFALGRVAADAALRSVYLGFGDSAPNFERRYKAFIEDKPNPFGGPKDLLREIRDAFKVFPAFVALGGADPKAIEAMFGQVQRDWGVLSSLTHSGEIQARFILHEIRTGQSPHDSVQTIVLFASVRVVTECVCTVLAQRGEPQRSGFVALELQKAFPLEQLKSLTESGHGGN